MNIPIPFFYVKCTDVPCHLLIHIDALGPEVGLGQLDLAHQLGVRVRRVAEREHTPPEAEEEPGAQRDERPERQLGRYQSATTCSITMYGMGVDVDVPRGRCRAGRRPGAGPARGRGIGRARAGKSALVSYCSVA